MERKDFSGHISALYNQYLEDLYNQVLEMGALVERQLESALSAVQSGDVEKAKQVVQLDRLINREEMDIDRLCVRVLARQQPTASDLRLIISAIRIAVDLERMGDEVVKIARLVVHLDGMNKMDCKNLQGYKQLVEISARGNDMLKTVLNAFTRLDVQDCAKVIEEEERVDDLFDVAMQEVTQSFKGSDVDVECLLELVYALRASERLTDHARNIAESTFYLVNGQDLRNIDHERLVELLQNMKPE